MIFESVFLREAFLTCGHFKMLSLIIHQKEIIKILLIISLLLVVGDNFKKKSTLPLAPTVVTKQQF